MQGSGGRKRTIALLGLFAVLYLVGNGSVSLWDRDEPRYAQTSREMLQSGDWVVPRFLDKVRTAKPVFIYWCQAAAMRAIGLDPGFNDAFAARLPSAIAMLLTLAALSIGMPREVGPERTFWTMFILGSSVLAIVSAKFCTTDAVLLLWIVLAQMSLYALWRGNRSWSAVIAMAIAIGFAGLTKGPVVLGVLGMTLLILWALRAIDRRLAKRNATLSDVAPIRSDKDPSLSKPAAPKGWENPAKWIVALVIIGAIVGPWLWLVQRRESHFLGTSVSHDVFTRVVKPLEGHRGPPGFHLVAAFGTFLPWSLLLPMALILGWKNRAEPASRFALAAVIGPWLMFEAVQTKLAHYILPAFPALAFLTADAIVRQLKSHSSAFSSKALRIGAAIWALAICGLGIPFLIGSLQFDPELRPIALLPIAAFTLFGLTVLLLLLRRRPRAAFLAMGFGMIASFILLFAFYLPRANYLRVSIDTANCLKSHGVTQSGQVIMLDYKEPSLAFYQGGTIRENSKNALTPAFLQAAPAWLVITRDLWEKADPAAKDRLDVVATLPGTDFADGRAKIEVVVVRKK